MEWIVRAAALPLIICGLMCFGAMALAAVGLRAVRRAPEDTAGVAGANSELDDAQPAC